MSSDVKQRMQRERERERESARKICFKARHVKKRMSKAIFELRQKLPNFPPRRAWQNCLHHLMPSTGIELMKVQLYFLEGLFSGRLTDYRGSWQRNCLKTWVFIPGTLAACCKPSSGAGVVWMNMKHRAGWVTPDHKNGDRSNKAVPCAYVLPLSHYTRALKSRKNASLRSRSAP